MNIDSLKKYFVTDEIDNWKVVFLNRMLIVYAFVLPFSRWWSKRLIITLLIIWMFSFIKKDLIIILKQKVVLYIIAFITLMGISWFYTELDPGTTIFYLKRFLSYLLLPLITISLILKQQYIKYVLQAFIFSIFINEIISYGIAFGWWLHVDELGFPLVGAMHHSTYSIFVAFTIMLTMYEILHTRSKAIWGIYGIFLLLMLGNLVLSGGRTGQISLLLAIITFAFLYYRKNINVILSFILIPILFFVGAYYLYKPFEVRTNQVLVDVKSSIEKQTYGSSVGNRIGSYILLSYIAKDNTVFEHILGHGAGELQWVLNSTIDEHKLTGFERSRRYQMFHNNYIDAYVGMGLVGLFLMIMILKSIFDISLRNHKLNYIKISFTLILIFSFMPHYTLYSKYIMLLMALFISIFIVQSQYEKKGFSES